MVVIRCITLGAVLFCSELAVVTARADQPISSRRSQTGARAVSPSERTAGAEGCQTIRRRLWVEGDGWVVRRVAVCANG
jgi:hypothetical protein